MEWKLDLTEVLNILLIVGILGGWGHQFILKPIIRQLETDRMHDNMLRDQKDREYTSLLNEIKAELKYNREERIRYEGERVQTIARLELAEKDIRELKEAFSRHVELSKD